MRPAPLTVRNGSKHFAHPAFCQGLEALIRTVEALEKQRLAKRKITVIPKFRSKAEEAAWWDNNPDFIADQFEKAARGEAHPGRAGNAERHTLRLSRFIRFPGLRMFDSFGPRTAGPLRSASHCRCAVQITAADATARYVCAIVATSLLLPRAGPQQRLMPAGRAPWLNHPLQ